jgi:16S rRNA (uracil1498-N3)-methyltransferase
LEVGEKIALFDGKGLGFTARIVELTTGSAQVVLEAEEPADRESSLRLVLVAALSKGEKFELVVQKATELGVSEVQPVYTQHADVRPVAGRVERRAERWRRVALEACKQSGRTRIPSVHEATDLEAALARCAGTAGIVMDPEGASEGWDKLFGKLSAAGGLTVAVGPEGGWSQGERESFLAAGYAVMRLGPRILRTETAAIVMTALLQFLAGDLGTVGIGGSPPGR